MDDWIIVLLDILLLLDGLLVVDLLVLEFDALFLLTLCLLVLLMLGADMLELGALLVVLFVLFVEDLFVDAGAGAGVEGGLLLADILTNDKYVLSYLL